VAGFELIANWIFDEKGQPQRIVMLSRDITRRKQAETALRELPVDPGGARGRAASRGP
jgi:PAS domain-containing protein